MRKNKKIYIDREATINTYLSFGLFSRLMPACGYFYSDEVVSGIIQDLNANNRPVMASVSASDDVGTDICSKTGGENGSES